MLLVSAIRARQTRVLFALLCGTASALSAQAQAAPAKPVASAVAPRTQFETREQLQAQIEAAQRQNRTATAFLLKSRLERGDFQEGDKIVVVLEGAQSVLDTLQVRSGKVLQFPRMGEVQLNGVLRSELTDIVRQHLARYLTTPVVRATPLLPVAVFGKVSAPGYYHSAADVVLRDLIMRAGPLGESDMNKIVVKRAGEVIWTAADMRVALTDGLSLDGLHLRAGDEIYVPERRRLNTTTIIALLSSTLALTMAVVNMSNPR
jgi:hypothetical protein